LGFVVGVGVAVSTGSGVRMVGEGVFGVLVAVGVIPEGMGVFGGGVVAVGTASWRTCKPTLIDPGFPFAVNVTW
jgi:hypothetical protein